MKNLELHSLGQDDHLNKMREKYEKLREKLRNNSNLSAEQKQAELKKIDLKLKADKRNSDRNLY